MMIAPNYCRETPCRERAPKYMMFAPWLQNFCREMLAFNFLHQN